MKQITTHSMFFCLLFGVTACVGSSGTHTAYREMNSNKTLTCPEILLEMNEVEFELREVEAATSATLEHLMSPVSSLMGALNASSNKDYMTQRMAFLQNMYDINRCHRYDTAKETNKFYDQAHNAAPITYQYPQQPPQATMRQPNNKPQPKQAQENNAYYAHPLYEFTGDWYW